MKKCEVCGRESNRVTRLYGRILCSKHMHQLMKYGKTLDAIPRTTKDLNDYSIQGDVAVFNLYNQKNEKTGEFFIDLEDIERVKYKKWRLSHGHVITGLPAKGTQIELSWYLLMGKTLENRVIDHINGNPQDNRKSNLRICEQKENVLNKSFMSNNSSGFIGVSFDSSRQLWASEIRREGVRCRFKRVALLEEAVYCRYVAEEIVFGDFLNESEHEKKYVFFKDKISLQKQNELREYVLEKLKEKNLGN